MSDITTKDVEPRNDEITDEVLDQFDEVRRGGEVNMLNSRGIQRVAYRDGLWELTAYLGERPQRRLPALIQAWEERDESAS